MKELQLCQTLANVQMPRDSRLPVAERFGEITLKTDGQVAMSNSVARLWKEATMRQVARRTFIKGSTALSFLGTSSARSLAKESAGKGIFHRGMGALLRWSPADKGFDAEYSAWLATVGIVPRFYNTFTGFDTEWNLKHWVEGTAGDYGRDRRTDASSGVILVHGFSLTTMNGDIVYQDIPSGKHDGTYRNQVAAFGKQGYKELWVRPNYEENYGGTTPGNYGGKGRGPRGAEFAILRNAGWRHVIPLLRDEASKWDMTLKVIFNPTPVSWEEAAARPTNYDLPDLYDIVAVDMYSGNMWDDWSRDYPGYFSTEPFTRGFRSVATSSRDVDLWCVDGHDRGIGKQTYDNMAHQFDFTGNGQGWSLWDTVQLAKSHGKPMMIAEFGEVQKGRGGKYLLDSQGLGADLNLARYTRSRIDYIQDVMGVEVLTIMAWNGQSETRMSPLMLQSLGNAFPELKMR